MTMHAYICYNMSGFYDIAHLKAAVELEMFLVDVFYRSELLQRIFLKNNFAV